MELISIKPEERLAAFTDQFEDMELVAHRLKIDSDDTLAIGNEMIAKAKQLQNSIEDTRVAIYDENYPKDNRKVVKKANELAKGFKARLADIIKTVDVKYMTYRQKLKAESLKRQIEEQAAQERALKEAEAIKKRQAALFIPPTSRLQDRPSPITNCNVTKVAPVANVTKSDSGSSYIKKIKGFKVTDFSKVPDSYKALDEVGVRRMMNREDRDDIEGIEWILEEKLVTRVK